MSIAIAALAATIPVALGLAIRLSSENERLDLLSVIATTPLPDEADE